MRAPTISSQFVHAVCWVQPKALGLSWPELNPKQLNCDMDKASVHQPVKELYREGDGAAFTCRPCHQAVEPAEKALK